MAYFKIEQNSKGELQAKIQVSCKDIHTGKNKLVAKRVYNNNKLTEAKFRKFVEKEAIEFEEAVIKAYKEQTEFKARVLTFPELMNEWKQTISINLSHNYLLRAEDVEEKFNRYLKTRNLFYRPVSEIKIRDIQLFLNEFLIEQERKLPYFSLKKDICKKIPQADIPLNNALIKCSSFSKRKTINLTKKNAQEICEKYNLDFDEYFENCTIKTKYSPVTIKGYRRILRAVFNEAYRYDWIPKNPVTFTKVTSNGNNGEIVPVDEKEVFSIEESHKFLQLLSEQEDLYIHRTMPLKIMLLTGVRNGEIHGLKWSDIDFEKKLLYVKRARLYSTQLGCYEKEPKTKKSIRSIPMPDYLISELRKYMDWFRFADDDFDNKLDEYYICVNMYREKSHPSSLDDWLISFEKKTGQKRVTCHGLRHTYCSLLLSQSVPIQTVSKYMGHADSSITLRVYSHFLPDTQNIALNALNDILDKKEGN